MVSARDKVAYAISMHRMVDPGWRLARPRAKGKAKAN